LTPLKFKSGYALGSNLVVTPT